MYHHYLQGIMHPRWSPDFWTINSIISLKTPVFFFSFFFTGSAGEEVAYVKDYLEISDSPPREPDPKDLKDD